MTQHANDYATSTRHAWACTVFVLPLLFAYELGVWTMDVDASGSLRNGADTWLRWLLAQLGLMQSFWPGIFLAAGLIGWSMYHWQSRPEDLTNIWIGMVMESAVLALALWGLSLALIPFVEYVGIPLHSHGSPEPAMQMLVAFLGAGIYEEAVFRLLAFTLLCQLFRLGDSPTVVADLLAILVSALLFSTAHHIGPVGEPFNGYVFLFRTLAGVFFAVVYQFRGFGIAVGAHAFYDILVGVILTSS
jgi:hypothetical protein